MSISIAALACWSSGSFLLLMAWRATPNGEQSVIDAFQRLYGSADGIRVFRAPGRVNLIGEHTDYNLGFVLPVALDLATYRGHRAGLDGKLHIHSEDRDRNPPSGRFRRYRHTESAPPLDRLSHRRGAGADPRGLSPSSRPTS
jgi:hypothetical protein